MLNPHTLPCPALPGLPVRSTPATVAGSLNISLQLASERGSPAPGFGELRAYIREHGQLPAPLSPAQREVVRRSLLSTMLLAEQGLLVDPGGLLTLDALASALAEVLTSVQGVPA